MSLANVIPNTLSRSRLNQRLLSTPKNNPRQSPQELSVRPEDVLEHQLKTISGEMETHGELVTALEITLDSKYIISGSADSKIHIWDTLLKKIESTIESHTEGITCLLLSIDNQYLLSGSRDGIVKLWDFDKRKEITTLNGHQGQVNCLAFADDYKYIFSCSDDNIIKVWNYQGNLVENLNQHNQKVTSCVVLSSYLISGSADKNLLAWDLSRLDSYRVIKEASQEIVSLTVSYDRLLFASAEFNKLIHVWDGTTLELKFELEDGSNIKQIKFSGNSEYLVVNADIYYVYLWNVEKMVKDFTIEYFPRVPISLCVNYDCTIIVEGFNESGLKLWHSSERRDESTLYLHNDIINDIVCTSDERYLLSVSSDKTLKIYDLENKEVDQEIKSEETMLSKICTLNIYDNLIISTHEDGSINFWNIHQKKVVKSLKSHHQAVNCLAINKKCAASGSNDGKIVIWDLDLFKEDFVLSAKTHNAYSLIFCKNSPILYSCGNDSFIRKWSIETRTEISSIIAHFNTIWSIALTVDENYLFSASSDSLIKVWDLNDYSLRLQFEEQKAEVRKILLMSTNKTLISAANNGIISFWSINRKKLEFSLKGHKKGINSIILNQDETLLISGGENNMIIIWKIKTQSIEFKLSSHSTPVRDLFLMNDNTLLSCSQDISILMWDLDLRLQKDILCHQIGKISKVAISGNDRYASFIDDQNGVYIVDLINKCCKLIGIHPESVCCIVFSNNSKLIATGSKNKNIKIWSSIELKKKFTLKGHSEVLTVSFNYNSKLLISGFNDNSLNIWNIKKRKISYTLNYSQPVYCILTSKKYNWIYFGCNAQIALLNLIRKKEEIVTPKILHTNIFSIQSDPLETLLIYSDFNKIIIYDTTNKSVLFKLKGHSNLYIFKLIYLPNNKTIISSSNEKSVKIWRIEKGYEIKTITFVNDFTYSMDITSNKDLLICGLFNGEIKIWKLKDRSLYAMIKGHTDSINIIKVSSNNEVFATAANDYLIKLWNIKYKKLLNVFKGHVDLIRGIEFMENDRIFVSCSYDRTIRYWDISIEKEIISYRAEHIYFCCLHLYNGMVVTGSNDSRIVFWDKIAQCFYLDCVNGCVLCITSIGEKLISGSSDKTIKIWNVNQRHLIKTIYTTSETLASLLIMNDEVLISSCFEKSINSWDIINLTEIESYSSHSSNVYGLVKLSQSKFISCSFDNTLRITDIKNKEESGLFKDCGGKFTCLQTTENYLFIGSLDGTIHIYELKDEKEYDNLLGHNDSIEALELYGNNLILISGSRDNTIKFWDLLSKNLIDTKNAHSHWIRCLRVSPDQRYLVSGSADNSMIIWALNNRSIFRTINGHKSEVTDIRFTEDSLFFFSSSADFTIKMWELNSGKEIQCLVGHTGIVWNIGLIDEKKILISCSADRLLKFWNYESRRELFSLKGHTNDINKIDISKNKKYVISGGDDKTVKIWNIDEKRLEFTLLDNLDMIYGLKIIHEQDLLCTCSIDGKINIWNIQKLKFDRKKVDKIREIKSENYTLICDNKYILNAESIHKNQHSHECVPSHALDVGLNNLSFFYSFVDSIQEKSFRSIFSGHSSLRISSCLFGVAHFLSYLGKEKDLERLLNDNCVIFSDIFGKSPFYYANVKNHSKCSEILIEFLMRSNELMLSQEWKSSMFSIRNDFELIIRSSIYQVGKFLKFSKIVSKSTFISSSINLPCIALSTYEIPIPQDFDEDSSSIEKRQVYFITFLFPLPAICGSTFSIELTESILNCQDKDIYSTTVIKEYIDSQWNSAYPIIASYAISYFMNIIFLLCLVSQGYKIYFFVPFLLLNLILAIWEIAQVFISWRNYIQEIWNYIDVLRLILTIIWVFYIDSNMISLTMVVVLLNLIRGLTAFKIFDGTRYYIKLILLSMNEIKYFLVMFAYSNIVFGVLYYLINENKRSFFDSIFKMYNLNFGFFETDGLMGFFDHNIFIMATIINLIIMLNLLISILGEFHDRFQVERTIIDYQEKAETCLEIQLLMFWRREYNETRYLHKAFKVGESEENETWEGRILFFKNQIQSINISISELNTNLTNKISKKINEISFDLKDKFEHGFLENNLRLNQNQIESNIMDLEKKLEAKIKGMEKKIESIMKEDNNLLNQRLNEIENKIITSLKN